MMTAMSKDGDNNDNDVNDDDDGYIDGGRQQWRRLAAPVPIDGVL